MSEDKERYQGGETDYECPHCSHVYNYAYHNRCPNCGLYHKHYKQTVYNPEPGGIIYKNLGADNWFQCNYCGFAYDCQFHSYCPRCGVSYTPCCNTLCNDNEQSCPCKEDSCCDTFVFSSSHVHSYQGESSECFDHCHGYLGITGKPERVSKDGQHIHIIYGQTFFSDSHIHFYENCTSPAIPVPGGHIHRYETTTFQWNGHCHEMCGETGLDEEWDKDHQFHKKKLKA